jgi:hypothetical protein
VRTFEQVHAFLPSATPTPTSSVATRPAPAVVKRQTPHTASAPPRSRASSWSSSTLVRDVAPLAVDVPSGLGSVAAAVGDDSVFALAALALLAAAAAAASGAGLALVWSRQQGLVE